MGDLLAEHIRRLNERAEERRQRPRKDEPTVSEIRACFHRIWTAMVGTKDYKKRDWQELRRMLKYRGVDI